MVEKLKKTKLIRLCLTIADAVARYEIAHMAASIAYYFILAIFPFLMFLAALVGILRFPADALEEAIRPLLSAPVAEAVLAYYAYLGSVTNLFSLLFGFVFSLYSASRAVQALNYGVNKVYETHRRRTWLRAAIQSVLFTVGISAVLLFALFAVSVCSDLPVRLWLAYANPMAMRWIVYGIALGGTLLVLTSFYCLAPVERVCLRCALPGALFCVLGLHAISFGVSIYVRISTRFSVLYGSIGAVIILLLWLYAFGVCVLLGALLNRRLEMKIREKADDI